MRARDLWHRLRGALAPERPRVLAPVEAYERWAATYDAERDSFFLREESSLLRSLLRELPLRGARVLDVGCGTGRHWPELYALEPATLVGADASPAMLARLRARYPSAPTHLLSSAALPVASASFDLVLSTLVLGHLAEPEPALREWARALRPEGALVLTDFHPDAARAGMHRSFRHQGALLAARHHPHALSTLTQTLEDLGFAVTEPTVRALRPSDAPHFRSPAQRAILERHLGTPFLWGLLARRRPC